MIILWKNVYSLEGELIRKLISGLQTIAHSNKTQEERMSNREYIQERIN